MELGSWCGGARDSEAEIDNRQRYFVVDLVCLPMVTLPDSDLRRFILTKRLERILLLQMQPMADFVEVVLVFWNHRQRTKCQLFTSGY